MADIKTRTRPFDVSTYLRAPKDIAAYLSAALDDGDPATFQRTLGDVARARSVAAVAGAGGLGCERFYKALSQTADLSFDTVHRVIAALGLTPAPQTAIAETG